MRNTLLHLVLFLFISIFPFDSIAQFSTNKNSIGIGYLNRSEEANNGLLIQAERILTPLRFDQKFRIRARVYGARYLEDELIFSLQSVNTGEFIDIKVDGYSFGGMVLADIITQYKVTPYVGLGFGYEEQTVDFESDFIVPAQGGPVTIEAFDASKGSTYFETLLGFHLDFLELIQPFLEYRLVFHNEKLEEFQGPDIAFIQDLSGIARFSAGIKVNF